MAHMLVTWLVRRPPAAAAASAHLTDSDVITRLPNDDPETQALLGDGHVIRRYSRDDWPTDGGRQGDDDVAESTVTSRAVS